MCLDVLNVSIYFSGIYFKMFENYGKLPVSENSPPSLKQSEHLFPDALNKRRANIQWHINAFICFKAVSDRRINYFLGSENVHKSNGPGNNRKAKSLKQKG